MSGLAQDPDVKVEDELWTISKVKQWSTNYLRQKGSASPGLDSEILIAKALGCSRIELYTALEKPLSSDERTRVREFIFRRAQGEPVAYIVESRAFWRFDFKVTKDVLIPRPETELLLEVSLNYLKKYSADEPLDVLDVGTGSGCLAISLAKELNHCSMHAWDISPPALSIAENNAKQLETSIHFSKKDALDPLSWCEDKQFNLIISNPPYIAEHDIGMMDQSVLNYEPKKALFADANGYRFYEVYAEHARKMLKKSGAIAVEIGLGQEERVRDLFLQQGWVNLEVYGDLAKIPRVIFARLPEGGREL